MKVIRRVSFPVVAQTMLMLPRGYQLLSITPDQHREGDLCLHLLADRGTALEQVFVRVVPSGAEIEDTAGWQHLGSVAGAQVWHVFRTPEV